MADAHKDNPKPPSPNLHTMNLVVATLAGIISIVGGVYSLKANLFSVNTYGSLKGVVKDQVLAKPLWQSPIEVSDPDGKLIDSGETDQSGQYFFQRLKEGSYVVKVAAPRHEVQSKDVRIERDKTSTINFTLIPVSAEPETVSAPSIQIASPVPSPVPAQSYQQPVASNTIPVQPVPTPPASSMNTAYPQTSASFYPPAQESGYMTSQNQEFPSRRGYHRRRPPSSWGTQGTQGAQQYPYDSQNPTGTMSGNMPQQSATSLNDVLMQAGGQLLQNMISKKTNQNSSATSESTSATSQTTSSSSTQ